MRGRCPHCGELNQFDQAPAAAVVYCQSCGEPFGAAALLRGSAPPAPRPGRGPIRTQRPKSAGVQGVPPRQESWARDPTEVGLASPLAPRSRAPGEMDVIVPNLVSRTRSASDPAPAGRPRLVYSSVEGVDAEFTLGARNTVGRHPKNTIRLHDREVSKYHAVIERSGEGFILRDLGSSNGSFLNNRQVEEAELSEGDSLLFGSMRLTFTSLGAAPTADRSPGRDMVTILPENSTTQIHAKLTEENGSQDFLPAADIEDVDVLRRDYEKLRVAHEIARMGIKQDFSLLLQRSLEMAFQLLPADNGVILLVEPETGVLAPHTVRRREGDTRSPGDEIVLSTSIINQVVHDRSAILLSDAVLDPRFSGAQSVISQGIRSAMSVPLVANDTVYGVMHIDSRQRIGAFSEKDLQLLQALANQAATAIANTRLLRKVEDDARTRGQLSRFLSAHIVEQMVEGKGAAIVKGGKECEATVLFCDIRDFTPMSEAAGGPQEIVSLLNEYFEVLVDVVFDQGGVLDKFIGDALMAHWGTLEDDEDPHFRAVVAALGLRDAIDEYNLARTAEGKPPIGMGVGVNTGTLVAGYMGAKRRLEYTVIGDTVNTAARLCGMAEPAQVLISDSTYERIADRIEARYLGTKRVKGKEQAVEVYEALSFQPPET